MAHSGSSRDFAIDDEVDREDEFKKFEQEQKEAAERKEVAKKELVKKKEKEKDDRVEEKMKNKDTIFIWGPTLITAPLVPAFLALISAAIGTAVLEWSYASYSQTQCQTLQGFVAGEVVVCYAFVAVYMTLLIGPQCCARACGTPTLLFVYWGLFGVIFLALNAWGLYEVIDLRAFCANPLALSVYTVETEIIWWTALSMVVLFWGSVIVLVSYLGYYCYWKAQLKKKQSSVLQGLKVGKKNIDYSGYKSVKEEALVSSSDDEEFHPLEFSKKKLNKKRVSQFEDWEKEQAKAAGEAANAEGEGTGEGGGDTEAAAAADDSQATAEPAAASGADGTEEYGNYEEATSSGAYAEGQQSYDYNANAGYDDQNYSQQTGWEGYTPEEIAAYEAQQQQYQQQAYQQ